MNDNLSRLRPEAKVFDFDELTISQLKAMDNIMGKLKAAHNNLTVISAAKNKSGKKGNKYTFFVEKDNKNRMILLSGGRGSGKTSVLYSVVNVLDSFDSSISKKIRLIKEEEIPKNELAELNLKNIKDKSTSEIGLIIEVLKKSNDLQKKLIWLQPLEMETLPPASNLLAAILNRVDEAINRFRAGHPNIYQDTRLGPDEQDVLLEFTKLQQDVALAWSGNLDQHAVNLDPDSFAVEVLRAEQNRLDLDQRIESILDQLHETFIRPNSSEDQCMFVLPVDDFDINPHRCLELVRMIRMLNVPRLFTLILGDKRIISHLLNLKFIESIVRLEAKNYISIDNVPYDECRISHELSANAMRKLFAWSSQVSLEAMSADEVLKFKPKNDYPDNTISEHLEKYQNIKINSAHFDDKQKCHILAKTHIKDLNALFNIKIDHLIKNSLEKDDSKNESDNFYVRNFFFRMYPRHAQDLWIELHNKISSKETEYLKFAENLYRDKIREAKDLTSRLSEFLNGILIKDFERDYQLNSSSITLVYSYNQPIVIERKHKKPFIGLLRPKNWYLKVAYPKDNADYSNIPNEITLNDATASGIILMHDLLAFKNQNLITGNKLLPETPSLWAYTQWPFGGDFKSIKIPWHFPPWLTMFECDLLRRCWIEVWNWTEEYKKKDNSKRVDPDELVSFLFYAWLRIITDILSTKKMGVCFTLTKSIDAYDKDNWENILNEILDLYSDDGKQYERRRFIIRGWFVAIGCLLAPESGLLTDKKLLKIIGDCQIKKSSPNRQVSFLKEIQNILITPIIASGIRKLRARSAVLFFDNGAVALLKKQFEPNKKREKLPEHFSYNVTNANTNEKFINEIGKGILCPYKEDIIMLSKQAPKLRRQFAKELMSNGNK